MRAIEAPLEYKQMRQNTWKFHRNKFSWNEIGKATKNIIENANSIII